MAHWLSLFGPEEFRRFAHQSTAGVLLVAVLSLIAANWFGASTNLLLIISTWWVILIIGGMISEAAIWLDARQERRSGLGG